MEHLDGAGDDDGPPGTPPDAPMEDADPPRDADDEPLAAQAQVLNAEAAEMERATLEEKVRDQWVKLRAQLSTSVDADGNNTHPPEEVVLAVSEKMGWRIICRARKRTEQGDKQHFDFFYHTPSGDKLRAMPQVAKHLGYLIPKKEKPTPKKDDYHESTFLKHLDEV